MRILLLLRPNFPPVVGGPLPPVVGGVNPLVTEGTLPPGVGFLVPMLSLADELSTSDTTLLAGDKGSSTEGVSHAREVAGDGSTLVNKSIVLSSVVSN